MEFSGTEEGTSGDYESRFNSGLKHHENGEWMQAYECFKEAEAIILNEIGIYFKNNGRYETANQYFKRAQKAANRIFKLAPPGSNWLKNLLIIIGIIAIPCVIWLIVSWPGIYFLIGLIFLLLDLLVFLILFPIALVKHVTQRRKSLSDFHSQLRRVENQITALENIPDLTEFQKFYQIGKLKVKRARMAGAIVRYEYSKRVERGSR